MRENEVTDIQAGKGQLATNGGEFLGPVFVVGVDRSGTTLLSLIISSHPLIAIPYESHFIVAMAEKYGTDIAPLPAIKQQDLLANIINQPYVKDWDYEINSENIELTANDNVSNIIEKVYKNYARQAGKSIWGDKSPDNTPHIDSLNKLYPDAKYIHIIRDGRDVADSIKGQHWGGSSLPVTLRHWDRTVTLADKMLGMLAPAQVHSLRFEDLVSSPEESVRAITSFLGVAYSPDMLTDYSTSAEEKVGDRISGHHAHLKEALSPSQAFKWQHKMSPVDQSIAYEIVGETLQKYGYLPGVTHHPLKGFRKLVHYFKNAVLWRWQEYNDDTSRKVIMRKVALKGKINL